MKQASREEYERAVALARTAIREERNAPRIRADRSPQAVLAKMKKKQAEGEELTEADFGAMAAALAKEEGGKRWSRGRPKGARAEGHRALRAAMWAVQESGLRPYRNCETGPKLSQCDAIAEAMKAEGYNALCSYDAARRELIVHRRGMKSFRGIARQLQALQRMVAENYVPLARQVQEAGRAMNLTLEPLRRQLEGIQQNGAALRETLRAQVGHLSEVQRAIADSLKRRR